MPIGNNFPIYISMNILKSFGHLLNHLKRRVWDRFTQTDAKDKATICKRQFKKPSHVKQTLTCPRKELVRSPK